MTVKPDKSKRSINKRKPTVAKNNNIAINENIFAETVCTYLLLRNYSLSSIGVYFLDFATLLYAGRIILLDVVSSSSL